MPDLKDNFDWIKTCLAWRGVILRGEFCHWCHEWDYLPVDETTPEWYSCMCYPQEVKNDNSRD